VITVIDNGDDLNIAVSIAESIEPIQVSVVEQSDSISTIVSQEAASITVDVAANPAEVAVTIEPATEEIAIEISAAPSSSVGVVVNTGGEPGPIGPAGPAGGSAFEAVSKNIQSWDAEYNYVGTELTSIVYTDGSNVITKTLGYTDDYLTSIVLSGDTPAGIELTKMLNYTNGILTSVNYS